MKKEIKRSTWSRFCKQFSAQNQYRTATVTVERGKTTFMDERDMPFLGVRITKSGRYIDGVELHVARTQPEEIGEPLVSVKSPKEIILKQDSDGNPNEIMIKADDGTKVTVTLARTDPNEMQRRVIETIAYSLAERRGFTPGNEQNDWFTAEETIRNTEKMLAK